MGGDFDLAFLPLGASTLKYTINQSYYSTGDHHLQQFGEELHHQSASSACHDHSFVHVEEVCSCEEGVEDSHRADTLVDILLVQDSLSAQDTWGNHSHCNHTQDMA